MGESASQASHDAKYPEHVKLRAVKPDADVIASFLEWLDTEDLTICRIDGNGDYETAFIEYAGQTRFASISALLEAYFEIDPWKLDDEKKAMLEECREAYESTEHAL